MLKVHRSFFKNQLKNTIMAKTELRLALEKEAKEKAVKFNKNTTDDALQDLIATAIATQNELVEVKFLLSPTGAFKLGYNIGDTAFLLKDKAVELVDAEFAEYVK